MPNNENWLIDLDGVIWLGTEAIKGADRAVARLQASGQRRVGFFTNNSFPTRSDLLNKLKSVGISCAPQDMLSSAQAAASLCKPGERALYLGGRGIAEALEAHGVEAHAADYDAPEISYDVVIVGFDPAFDFARLAAASAAVHSGARLIGTNEDATYPTPAGPVPGGGSLLAAVAYASGAVPIVAGKPHDPAITLIESCFGHIDVAVGDRASTDGELAVRLQARFGLVYSGVTSQGEQVSPTPTLVADDLSELVDGVLSSEGQNR